MIERHVNPIDFQGPLGVMRPGVIVVALPEIEPGTVRVPHDFPLEWGDARADLDALGLEYPR